MRRKICWCLAALTYWAIIVHFLQVASPVFIDGSGPVPSFQWRKMPTPGIAEYMRRRGHYDLIYSVPYLVAGLTLTVAGCVAAPLIVRRARPLASHPFWVQAGPRARYWCYWHWHPTWAVCGSFGGRQYSFWCGQSIFTGSFQSQGCSCPPHSSVGSWNWAGGQAAQRR